ncbi:MAG: hypothetical protein KatS3mg068_2386 [Candidatus Sericytochromatia bacterium]|nr:MAG: hypothetical protein KatS3mg068_2386 [Candidatus Sericytochromatia bacterium]
MKLLFFDTISNILIRSISTNKLKDFYFIIEKVTSLLEILETEEKKFNLFSKILLKLKQLNFINDKYKEDIFKLINSNLNFNNDNLKIFSYNNLISICNNINDKNNRDLYINNFISFFKKLNITSNNIFPLIQISLTLLKGIDSNNSILIIDKIIENEQLKNYNDAIIFLFKELSFLGNLYLEDELINKISNIINKINQKSLNDKQLYNIAISYIQIDNFEKFISYYTYIKDINIKNRIQYEVINLLFSREDINNLKNFLEYTLDSSSNLDLLLSYIILLNDNDYYIDNLSIL